MHLSISLVPLLRPDLLATPLKLALERVGRRQIVHLLSVHIVKRAGEHFRRYEVEPCGPGFADAPRLDPHALPALSRSIYRYEEVGQVDVRLVS
jgi:hypothetical protein